MAHASITPVLVGSPTAVGGGVYSYTYDATLASDQAIEAGSFFTLYDFGGFTGFGSAPANFTGSAALTGKTPAKTAPTDDASILNVTFTYTGPTFNLNGTTSERDLGNFVVYSKSGGTVVFHDFTSLGYLNKGPTKGTAVATIGSNAVGVAGSGTPGTVPEPTTWGTMVAGLGLIGFAMRRRGPKSLTA